MASAPDYLLIDDICAMLRCSQSTVYKMIRSGDFPPPFKLCRRRNRWVAEEVYTWLARRIETRPVEAEPA